MVCIFVCKLNKMCTTLFLKQWVPWLSCRSNGFGTFSVTNLTSMQIIVSVYYAFPDMTARQIHCSKPHSTLLSLCLRYTRSRLQEAHFHSILPSLPNIISHSGDATHRKVCSVGTYSTIKPVKVKHVIVGRSVGRTLLHCSTISVQLGIWNVMTTRQLAFSEAGP